MRDIGDAWYPSKIKVGSQIPARIVNLIPTMANEGSLDYNERNMKEIGGRTQGWEKIQERIRLRVILWIFQGINYSRGIGNAWHPSKTHVGSY